MKVKSILILAFISTMKIFGQDSIPPSYSTEVNFITEPQEPSYGLQLLYQQKISKSNGQFALYGGGFESFLRTNENVSDEGTKGHTFENNLGGLITGELRFLKKRNLFFNVSALTGWGYRKTKVNLHYPDYKINVDYTEDYHYLKLAVDSKVGYRLKNIWGIHFIAKYDFSRIADQYRNILGEKPGFIYGLGLTYNWRSK